MPLHADLNMQKYAAICSTKYARNMCAKHAAIYSTKYARNVWNYANKKYAIYVHNKPKYDQICKTKQNMQISYA